MKLKLLFTKAFLALLTALTCVGVNELRAQQDAQFSMYMFNPLHYNPAYAGSRDALSLTLIGRQQWVGFDGAPRTAALTAHTPLANQRFNLGLSVLQDEIGPTSNTSAYGDFAFRIPMEKMRLSFGLRGGIDIYSGNWSSLIVENATDPVYLAPIDNELMPNFGFGVYLDAEKFYAGIASPKLIENDLSGNTGDSSEATQKRHFYLTTGVILPINSVVSFRPSIVVKAATGAPLSMDVDLSFLFYERLWVGAMFRTSFDDHAATGLNLVYHFSERFRMGYAYDYVISGINDFNSGSHEVMLNYDLDFNGKKYRSPRYF